MNHPQAPDPGDADRPPRTAPRHTDRHRGDRIRAVRITPDGHLEVVHLPPLYEALADAVGSPVRDGDIGITSAGTWRMVGVGYLTLWTAGTGPRNELAERIADRIVTKAAGGLDRIRDGIGKGSLTGTVLLAAYDRDTGRPADLGDVAVERVRVVVDGRLQRRQDATARAADTTVLDLPAPTTTLPLTPDTDTDTDTDTDDGGGAVVTELHPHPDPGGEREPAAAGGGS